MPLLVDFGSLAQTILYGEVSMPHSVVFHCVSEEDLGGDALRGMAYQDLVFQIMGRCEVHLAEQVPGSKELPFTVSPFFAKRSTFKEREGRGGDEPEFRGKTIRAGTPCRFRLTLLEDRLYQRLANLEAGNSLILDAQGRGLAVTQVFRFPHGSDRWPGSQTYAELMDRASSTSRELRLQFVTPTVFRRHGLALPLPNPHRMFKGILRTWNWFAFLPLSTDLESLIERHVAVKDFRISATRYDTGESSVPAFTGWCHFALIGRHHERHIKEFNLLGDYSFYCSTGDYRHLGMGVTRRL
jgi:CRISPR-associated endoribonuclease Cas6